MGFCGVDINFGCPDKTIVKNNCCSAMIKKENRSLAHEIIDAVKDAAGDKLNVSVKTRLGFNEVDYSWHTSLLEKKLNMLTIHARTRKEMSKVDAHWDLLTPIVDTKNTISPDTLIVGNGDVKNRADGLEKAEMSKVDGIMIGRGIFHDPYCFSENSPWENMLPAEKIKLYIEHIELYVHTYQNGKKFEPLKKFSKVYLHGFEGASDIRDKVVRSHTPDEMLSILKSI
jgi:tRNA-dihydrouridine synthase